MSPSALDEKEINDLIWGNLESEIMESKYSLYVASEVIKSAKVYPVKLLIGFLDFIHYKCGLVPELSSSDRSEISSDKPELAKIDDIFEDRSTCVKFLECVADTEIVHGEPYFKRQFVDQKGDEYTIFILMNTFSMFECGMILNKTKLKGEAKFSFDEIKREFHVAGKKMPHMLEYFKYFNNVEQTHAHTLVLRPTKLTEMLYGLDDEQEALTNCPEQVLRTEEWKETTSAKQPKFLLNVRDCNEENFQELLKERSIEIPNAQILTLYEYIRDKLTHEAAKEWEGIRDRYIAEEKKLLKYMTPGLTGENIARAKNLLADARKSIEEKRYTESISQSYIAMEESLSAKQYMPLPHKILSATEYPDLRKYREGLFFIKKTRDALRHADGMDKCDAVDAKFALDKMDQFLIGIQDSLHSKRFDENQ